uniref:ApbE family lipoprotein n=1 Tax=Desulfovibrio sp. U5L TaxID=596152 RepID=I2Q3J3_9BACT
MPPIHDDPVRAYRRPLAPRPGETAFQVVVAQTDLWIVADRPLAREIADFVSTLRAGLMTYILLHPEFRASLVPVAVPDDAPAIARDMAEAAARFGVGPMAAVAGAVSQAVADRFAPLSPNLLVENGGDVFLRSTVGRTVALLAKPVEGARLALHFGPDRLPAAVCASSAKVGPSLSLGQADMVTVVAGRGAVADAAATALGNLLVSRADLEGVLAAARGMARDGVRGAFVQIGEMVGLVGDLELVAIEGEDGA